MAEVSLRELDLEIESLSNNLETLNENLRCNFEEYVSKKSFLSENKSIGKDSYEFINALPPFQLGITSQIQRNSCTLNGDLKSLCDKLETTVECYVFIKKLLELDQSLQRVKEQMNTDAYKASEHLVKAKCLLDECSKSGRSLDFYRQKNEEYYNLLTSISMTTIERWNELVSFKTADGENKMKSASLIVSKVGLGSLETVFQTLEVLRVTYKETFRDHLIKDLIKPIIMYNCNIIIENETNFSAIIIRYTTKSSKLNFSEVVDGLVKLFSFINSTLDMKFESKDGFIPLIGAITSSELMKLFIEEHLSKKIPLKRSLLDEYAETVRITNELISVLIEKGFILGNDAFVKEYCSDIDNVFEAKVGSRYKEIAIYYMKKDLHDMMPIEATSLTNPMPELKQINLPLDETNRDNWNTFISLLNSDIRKHCFPECQISKSIYELVSMIHDCLDEAAQSSCTLRICLHDVAHEIVYEYLKSPDIHRKLLDIIPQQSALVFTNTIYLIMKLVQFDNTFKTDNLFSELIGQLQNMAFRELNKQIKLQEDIMISSLQKSGLQDLSELEVFPKMVEKVVRQCIRQVTLLKTVWINVLPNDIYCLIIGRLVNRFIEEIIHLILSATDIREDIAYNLVDMFTIITEKSPLVFPDSREVHRYVKSWFKLREIGLVLAGSLADISERWAGGSGLLAHELQPAQVRSLILALFQPSDIRERTLASIN